MIDAGAMRDLYGRIADVKRELERRRVEVPRTLRGRLYHNTTQSIANTTVTTVAFNTLRTQTGGAIATSLANALVATEAGWWQGAAHLAFGANAAGDRHVYIVHSSDGIIAIETKMAVTTGQPTDFSIPFGWEMAAGDSVSVQVYQASGGALVIASASGYTPEFWMEKTG